MATSLNLKNVAVVVVGPPTYLALDRDGGDYGEPDDERNEMEKLAGTAKRDWRKLLAALLKVDLHDRAAVADWLDQAGYLARMARRAPKGLEAQEQLPEREFHNREVVNFYSPAVLRPPAKERMVPCEVFNAKFVADPKFPVEYASAEYVSDGMLRWLGQWQSALRWALKSLNPKKFQTSVRRVRRHASDRAAIAQRRIKIAMRERRGFNVVELDMPHLDRLFVRDLGAPDDLPASFLETLIAGFGATEPLRSGFQLDEEGRPRCTVVAPTPMVAMTIAVLLDRAFTERGMGDCKFCGEPIYTRTATQEFCNHTGTGLSCQKKWNIKFLRNKERLVKEARERAPRKNDWKWIAARATRTLRKLYPKEPKKNKNMTITPKWAKERVTR